jgi:purine-nucleoside phosphorylase
MHLVHSDFILHLWHMDALFDRAREAVQYLKNRTGQFQPEVAIITGTGLERATGCDEVYGEISYTDIPGFVSSTVISHKGVLEYGVRSGKNVIIFKGRFHYYEGYSMQEVTFPVRVSAVWGIKTLICTNASGGVNPGWNAGDIVSITDHINLLPEHPLRGPNEERFGPRFPDMSEAYDTDLHLRAAAFAAELGITLRRGVYVALQGPSLETPAEYGMVYRLGGDCVGMSTVPEVIAARHAGMKVCAFSIIGNVCYPPERVQYTTVEDVIQCVQASAGSLKQILDHIVAFC